MGPFSTAQPVYRNAGTPAPARLDPQAITSLACDVSLISEHSTPPDALIARQVERLKNPRFTSLWWDIFGRLRADDIVPHRARVMAHVQAALKDANVKIDRNWFDALVRFFAHVHEAMFEHQTLDWLAESQFKLHLYG